jgi:4a-hydroxytetrahydrobiopterin dehydratase
MGQKSGWEEVDYWPGERRQKALRKDFLFPDFAAALEFVNRVSEIAEGMQHHPDLSFGWGYARVWTTTHSAHTITEKDHELTRAIDAIADLPKSK